MVANTSKMNKFKNEIWGMLDEEEVTEDMLYNLMEFSVEFDKSKYESFKQLSEMPDLFQAKIVKLTKSEIMSNPYLSNIEIPRPYVVSNNFKLTNNRIAKAGIAVLYDESERDVSTLEQLHKLFICDSQLRFPSIVEGNECRSWMTVEPFEINSFSKIIEEAAGDVLLLGCGLGYAAYMLSLKENVRSITIVDNSHDILDIFSKHILPQFENSNKISIVKSDGIDYLKTYDLTNYDYVNVDIWYQTTDMIYSYLRCLEIEKQNPEVKFSYWAEKSLKGYIQKAILAAICEFPTERNLINRIGQDIVRETFIKKPEDVYRLIDIKDLRNLLYTWYCNNINVVAQYELHDLSQLGNERLVTNAISRRLQKK